jgi:hypothetical protein
MLPMLRNFSSGICGTASLISATAVSSGAIAVMCGLIALPTSAQAATDAYGGGFLGDPGATVTFRIREDDAGRREAVFRYDNLLGYYEDGTTGRDSQPPTVVDFDGKRRFSLESLSAPTSAGTTSYIEIRGQLTHGGRRAKGYVVTVLNFLNPPLGGQGPDVDWSTHGRVYWKARRQ